MADRATPTSGAGLGVRSGAGLSGAGVSGAGLSGAGLSGAQASAARVWAAGNRADGRNASPCKLTGATAGRASGRTAAATCLTRAAGARSSAFYRRPGRSHGSRDADRGGARNCRASRRASPACLAHLRAAARGRSSIRDTNSPDSATFLPDTRGFGWRRRPRKRLSTRSRA